MNSTATVARLALLRDPATAFRLMVSHTIAPTGNRQVLPDPQRARSKEIEASVVKGPAHQQFDAEYKAVIALLDVPKEADTVVIFARLLKIADTEVMRVAAFAMALTLKVGDENVEAVGLHLNASAAEVWQADEVFFDLIRDRTTANAMLADVAGKSVAKSNLPEKMKTQKQIVRVSQRRKWARQGRKLAARLDAVPVQALWQGGIANRRRRQAGGQSSRTVLNVPGTGGGRNAARFASARGN